MSEDAEVWMLGLPWECPLCHLKGQSWLGNVRNTSVGAHLRIVHPDEYRHPSLTSL